MKFRTIRRLSILSAALLLFAAPAAHAQPPDGDHHLTPVTVVLNGSTTVHNIQLATLELPAVEAVSCDGNNSSDHSVWFKFTLPASASVDIDSAGSLLDVGGWTSTQFVMTLYSQSGLNLVETDCLHLNKPRIVGTVLDKGTHFVRLASDYAGPLAGPSQYRLSIRLRYVVELLADPEFDEPAGTAWKIKQAGEPPQIVRTCAGDCVVEFNGIAGGKILQKLSIDPSVMKIKAGDYFQPWGYINGTPPAGSDVKVILKLTYSDGTPPTKVSQTKHVIQTGDSSSDWVGGFAIETKSKALKSVKLMFTSPTAADTFRIIYSSLSLSAGSSVRGVLPLPAQP